MVNRDTMIKIIENAKEEGRKQGAVDFAKRINTEMEERLFRTDSARLEFIYKLIKKELK